MQPPCLKANVCHIWDVGSVVPLMAEAVPLLLCVCLYEVQGVCCQIMAVPPDVLQREPEDEAGNTWKYPPTAMVHMARDKRTALGVAEMYKTLAAQVCQQTALLPCVSAIPTCYMCSV